MTLEDFLNQALIRQYPEQISTFSPPERLGEYFVELVLEPVLVHLATGVRTYVAAASGLAAGLENGNILIWSRWPCPALTLPESASVDLLAWDGSAAFLGASDSRRRLLHVYDLRICAHVGIVSSEEPIVVAAFSPSGTWAALVDQRRRLQAGPVDDGPLRQAGVLRFQPLGLAFSPGEGLLFSADQAGWLLHWTVPDLRVSEQVLIPRGPFQRAVFNGPRLLLEPVRQKPVSGDQEKVSLPVVWDIPASAVVSPEHRQDHGFSLDAGLLAYQTEDRRWLRKMHLGRPGLRVWASPSAGSLRLKDLDGSYRCYSASDGFPADEEQCRQKDWQELEVDTAGRFHWAAVEYALADPVMVRDGRVLYGRSLSRDRFFFWWDEPAGGRKAEPDLALPPEGKLPIRESLRVEIEPSWVPMPHQPTEFQGEAE